ncbi:MAG: flagellar basal body rod protein FlgB [Planctomycetes bacterium]|nr:flagellar basal body rod protein FlgB [Planctomycetota bacterium]
MIGLAFGQEIDVLERTIQFAGRRHELIAHNIANLTTPNYQPRDVDPGEFRATLAEAVEKRRASHPGQWRQTSPKDTTHVKFGPESLVLNPAPAERNVMFHDRNDRDLERTMQSLTENAMMYRQAMELLRSRFATLQTAIRLRV